MALEKDTWRALSPSSGVDNNWHVTNESDTTVAHCYGFAHDIPSGELLARRIAACLNVCRGTATSELEKIASA